MGDEATGEMSGLPRVEVEPVVGAAEAEGVRGFYVNSTDGS